MLKSRKELPRELLLIAFVSGACSMLVEIAGARAIAPYLGNTIYTWAAAIGLVLAALSVGYYAGGVLADRYNDRKHFSLILLAAGIMTLIVPLLGNMLVPFTILLELSTANLVSALILVPASIFYGMVSPYVIKLTSRAGHEGQGAGRVFAISTIGSILGAIGTGFILIPNVQLTHIFISAAIAMVLMSWIASPKKGALLDILPLALLGFLALQAGHANLHGGEVVYETDSVYYHILVLDGNYDGEPARFMLLDNSFSTGETLTGAPAFDYVRKSSISFELIQDVQNALLIGVAGGTQIEEVKKNFPGVQVDGVDIDPKAIEAGKRYFSLEDDDNTELIVDDARRHVKTTDKTYDLVLIDVFRGRSIPPHLATQNFLLELKGKMSQDGLVVVNVISALEGEDAIVFILLHNTFSSVFENVLAMPIGENPGEITNIVLIATDRDISSFIEQHEGEIYFGQVPKAPPLTDELNPIEIYVVP
ncbi:hypothetical protein GF412_00225 [Candidatus Micrarchaeota archaeon]|nr:hypothetical protein [Candidatus Micrarchaeota archaeon]MBD3417401.1 hypothetical protein [Candidatus Micrarchaeota archaeon]